MFIMSNFFSNPQNKSYCENSGNCSIAPSSYALEELLLNEIRQIAFYTVKLRKFGTLNPYFLQRTIRAISVIIINSAFNFEDYKTLLFETEKMKNRLKGAYLNCCKERKIKYELVETNDTIPKSKTLSSYLRLGQKLVELKQNTNTLTHFKLQELIVIFCKTTAINLEKLRQLGFVDDELNFKTLKFLNLVNHEDLSEEKLKRKIKEFAPVSYKITQILNEEIENRYGKRTNTEFTLENPEGQGILVSGSDLFELEQILEALKNNKINVYTSSTLFEAFCYPKFREYKNLKGHFDGEISEIDFSNFKGPVFITQNFLQNVDFMRRGIIFTTKIIAPEKMIRINNYDFSELKMAVNPCSEEIPSEGKKIILKYDPEEILNRLNAEKGKVCVVLGNFENNSVAQNFETRKLISLPSPVDTRLLSFIIENKPPEELEIVFTHCNTTTINFLLSIISKNISKIYLPKCPNAFVSPHITEFLVKEFNIDLI